MFDSARHSQYYYHAHRPGEHGHFHTFLRDPGMPPGATPVSRAENEPRPAGDDAIAHLVAISMDAHGRPLALFTVNRWVTGEAWYPAATVIRMLDTFGLDHANPSWPLNRWLTAMLRFYRPEIAWLLHRRDETVADRARHHPGVDVLEDRGLEVTSELPIDIERHLTEIRRALRRPNS